MAFPGTRSNSTGAIISKTFEYGTAGVNMALAPVSISDESLSKSINLWKSRYGRVEVRPGLGAFMNDVLSTQKIREIAYYPPTDEYVFVSGDSVLICDADGGTVSVLGTLSGTDLNAAVVMDVFENTLFITSGGPVQIYDGFFLQDLVQHEYSQPAPTEATSVKVYDNRLWISSGSAFWFSGTRDFRDFGRLGTAPEGEGETYNGGIVYVDEDDGDSIIGMDFYNDAIYIHKGPYRKSIHKVTGSLQENIMPTQTAQKICANNGQCFGSLKAETYFAGEGGIYRMTLVDQIGSVKFMSESAPVNPMMLEATVKMIEFSDVAGYLFALDSLGRVFAYSIGGQAWYTWIFFGFTPSLIRSLNGHIFIGMSDGSIFDLSESYLDDAGTPIQWEADTRVFNLDNTGNGIYVKDLFVALRFKTTGTVTCQAYERYGQKRARTAMFTAEGVDTAGFDGVAGFDDSRYGFDQDYVSKTARFRIERSIDNAMFRLSSTANVQIISATFKGHYLQRREGYGNDS